MSSNHSKIEKATFSTTRIGWIICILGALFYCYEYLLRIAPGAMVPELMQAFGLSAGAFGAMISLYYLIYTPMQVFVGVANDLYGPRRILILAVFVCAAGSLLFGWAHTPAIASAARLMLGFGSAFAFVGALKLASVWLPPTRFAMFVGAITALGMLGGMFGNVMMSAFVQQVGWREVYMIGTISGLALMVFIWLIVRDRPKGATQIVERVSYKLAAKGVWKIIKSPQMWVAGVVGSLFYLSLSAFAELWGNPFVQHVFGFTAVHAASVNSMVFVGWLVGSPLIGWISDRLERRRLPIMICAFFAAVTSAAVLLLPNASMFVVGTLLFFFGFFCSAENICFALGRENAPHELGGASVAFINLVVMLGGLVFQPLVGRFLDMMWTGLMQDGVRVYSAHDYRMALLLLPIGSFLALLLSFGLRETKAKMVGESILNGK